MKPRLLSSQNNEFFSYNQQRNKKHASSFCFAPFNTLEFHVSGQVRVCCGNRYKIVGNYPEQSVKEIWEGQTIKDFRNKLQKYDLSDGCQGCYKMLKNKNFTNLFSLDYDIFHTNSNSLLKNIKFELSNVCNLECEMCWGELSSLIRKNTEMLPPIVNPYDELFIKQLRPFWKNVQKVTFLGGEPFLIKQYYTLWQEILENNPLINILIVTNGTILNETIKQLLSQGNYYFAVSIDSFQKETYEKIRKNAVFEETMSNFEYFYQYSKKNNRWITINVCPMQQNWKEIPSMINEMNKRDINIFFNPVDFPSSHAIRGLDSNQIKEIYDFFQSVEIIYYKNNASIQNEKIFKALILQIKMMYEEIKDYETSEIFKITKKSDAEKYLIGFFCDKATLFSCSETIIEKNVNKIQQAFNLLNEMDAVKGLRSVMRLPDYLLFSEIVYTTAEKLAVRLQQSFKTY